jgi:hypothetical protein
MSSGSIVARVRGRVQTQWLALAAALVVLAGVLVAWGLSKAAERVEVVQVARPVQAGDELALDDLQITGVAYDGQVTGLVPAESLERLVGRVASVDLEAGALMQVGMWADAPAVLEGEDRVGAVLKAGSFPADLARGDVALAAALDTLDTLGDAGGQSVGDGGGDEGDVGDGGEEGGKGGGEGGEGDGGGEGGESAGPTLTTGAAGTTSATVTVRVLDIADNGDGRVVITLAVPAAYSVAVARLAATDRLLLVGRDAAGAP